MPSFKVAITGTVPKSVEAALQGGPMPLEIFRVAGTTEEELAAALAQMDAVIVGAREPISARVIGAMGRCRVISRFGVGTDNIDLEAATRRGIAVACVPDASVEEVSDHAIALLLACARRLFPLNRAVKSGARPRQVGALRQGMRRLRGLVVGVAGFGRIGQATWQKAQALGLKGMVYDRLVDPALIRAAGAQPVPFEELLRHSDFITLHVPLTDQTKHLLGRRELALMKSTAYIINTARGALIDEEALAEALAQGRIAGAALDVTQAEPLAPEAPLLALEQVILTGHSAFYSEESSAELSRRAAENALAVLRGETPNALANPEIIAQEKRE